MRGENRLRRYIIALGSLIVGSCAGLLDFWIGYSALPPPLRVPGQRSPEVERLIFDACVTCYGIAYPTGRLLYRWLGFPADAELLHGWSRYHMMLLKAFGGVWLVAEAWQAFQQAQVLRPAAVVGLLLLSLAARDVWCALRRVRNTEALNGAGAKEWRARVYRAGWLLPVVALVLSSLSCAGLLDDLPGLAFLLGGLTLFVGGFACWYIGRNWNPPGIESVVVPVSLRVCGWAYMVFGALFALRGIVGAIRTGGFRNL